MVILGLLLIVLGVVAIAAAVFVGQGTAMILGIEMSALTIFVAGVATGAAILWGITLMRVGAKRTLQHRRDRKERNQLARKLEQVEAERRRESQPPGA